MFSEKEVTALLPRLKAFAYSTCKKGDQADDLVQETLFKAWKERQSFKVGSNLKAWLFTILRNTYLSGLRKRRREVEDADGHLTAHMHAPDNPEWHVRLKDLAWAWHSLPFDQREALMLVGVEGLPYEDAAEILDCQVGTVKSRVNRARQKLADILGEDLPKNALETAWEKVQECVLYPDDEEMPSILSDATE